MPNSTYSWPNRYFDESNSDQSNSGFKGMECLKLGKVTIRQTKFEVNKLRYLNCSSIPSYMMVVKGIISQHTTIAHTCFHPLPLSGNRTVITSTICQLSSHIIKDTHLASKGDSRITYPNGILQETIGNVI